MPDMKRTKRDLTDSQIETMLRDTPEVEPLTEDEFQEMRANIQTYLRTRSNVKRPVRRPSRNISRTRIAVGTSLCGTLMAILLLLIPRGEEGPPHRVILFEDPTAGPSEERVIERYHFYPSWSETPSAATSEIRPPTRTQINAIPSEGLCGPRSLWVATMRLGIPASLEDIINQCPRGVASTSFLDLKNIAESMDLIATGVCIDPETLADLDTPAILHTSENHFICADPREKETGGNPSRVRIYDLPRPAVWKTCQELESMWNGETLLISLPSQVSSSRGPRIQFDTLLSDFGIAEVTAAATFRVQNVGDAPLRIEEVIPECACTKVHLPTHLLNPGEDCCLTTEVDLRGLGGPQLNIHQLRTNDLGSPIIDLVLQGTAGNSIHVSTNRIDLGHVFPPRSTTAEFFVTDRGDQTLQLLESRVSFPPDATTAQTPSLDIRWSSNSDSCTLTPTPSTGVVSVPEPDETERFLRYRILVSADFQHGIPPGELRGMIHISTNRASRRQISIPFVVAVLPDYYTDPPTVAFGVARPLESVTRIITLKRRAKKPVALRDTSDEDPVSLDIVDRKADAVTLHLKFNCPQRLSGQHVSLARGTVQLQPEDGHLLDLPWSSIIEPGR